MGVPTRAIPSSTSTPTTMGSLRQNTHVGRIFSRHGNTCVKGEGPGRACALQLGELKREGRMCVASGVDHRPLIEVCTSDDLRRRHRAPALNY
eukprot:1194695-Prorocentrum_minimum.AAC.2